MKERYIKAIKIKDIKTQLTNGKGKLGLVLECYGSGGMSFEVEIPDIDLNLPELEFVDDKLYRYNTYKNKEYKVRVIGARREGYISFKVNEDENGTMATYKEIERTISREELEKELGYKLNIQ